MTHLRLDLCVNGRAIARRSGEHFLSTTRDVLLSAKESHTFRSATASSGSAVIESFHACCGVHDSLRPKLLLDRRTSHRFDAILRTTKEDSMKWTALCVAAATTIALGSASDVFAADPAAGPTSAFPRYDHIFLVIEENHGFSQ